MIFKSSYGKIFYELHENSNSKTIAFFHGASLDHKMFESQIPEFKKNYQVLVWDMPWHGQSFEHEDGFVYSVVSDCFIELLDELGIEKVVLSGMSLGGFVIQYIAYHYPDRIEAVHMDGATPLHMKPGRLFRLGIKIQFGMVFKLIPWKTLKKQSVKMLATRPKSRQYLDESFSKAGKERMKIIGEGNALGIVEGIDEPLSQPVLMTHGEHEMGTFKKRCAKWNKKHPDHDYVVIPGESHMHIIDKPSAYTEILSEFLQKLP